MSQYGTPVIENEARLRRKIKLTYDGGDGDKNNGNNNHKGIICSMA